MSALGTRNGGPPPTEQVISPTLVESGLEDRSYVDSVVEMISDVVPVGVVVNAGSAVRKGYRPHEHVNWVKMVQTDVLEESETLVIGMGYGDGIQLFALPPNGVARVILSRRNSSPVKDYCLLPAPPKETKCELSFRELAGKTDLYTIDRPLVAICELNTIKILAVHSGQSRHTLNYNAQKVVASRNALVAACPMQIAVFGAHDFSLLFVLPTAGHVPVAISCRWIAYAEKTLSPSYATPGGLLSDDSTTVKESVLQAALNITNRITDLTGSCSPPRRNLTSPTPGIVSVVDVLATDTDRRLLHFQAHRDTIAAMCFDPAGNLLLTADTQGRRFHVFRLLPHPEGSAHAKVDHLYTLYRGDTTAAVWDMAFSLDSRWVSVCTARGTAHVFPVAPYGGRATVRTHEPYHVVNKLSTFHRSAGVDQDADMPEGVHPAVRIRHSLANGDCDAGSRKGDGMLLSMGFSAARAHWLNNSKPKAPPRPQRDSLFTVTTAGLLVEYMLELRPPVHDGPGTKPRKDTLSVDVGSVSANLVAHWQLLAPNATASSQANSTKQVCMAPNRRPVECTTAQTGCWMSQVEIFTYAAPHRRLWMGPQFSFRPGHLQQGTMLVIHDSAIDGGLVEVESTNALIAEHIKEAMNEQSAATVHSSADSLYHSPSQSSEHLLIFDADLESL